MATKRPSPLEKPPAVSSSDEEEEVESSEEEEEQQQQREEQKPQHKKASSSSISPPAPAVNKQPSKTPETQPHTSSDEEDDDESSESDSDHPPPPRGVAAVPNVKPIVSKPMDVDGSEPLKKPTKSKPASTAAAAATPTKSSSKRPVANSGGEVKDSNRAKKKQKGAEADGGNAAITVEVGKKASAAAAGEGSKRASFLRVWSEEDEIAILEGMMDYAVEKGLHPATDLDGFYHFIKKALHHDAARTQLLDKVRKLKKKFENNAAKSKNGEDPIFLKPHDKIIYDLSKKIWAKEAKAKANASANNGGGGDQPKPNGKARKSREPLTVAEKEELLASLRAPTPKDAPPPSKKAEAPNAGHSNDLSSIMFNTGIVGDGSGLVERFVKDGLALVDSAKMSELEEKWRKLRRAEAETSLRRIELVHEQTKLILDGYKNQP